MSNETILGLGSGDAADDGDNPADRATMEPRNSELIIADEGYEIVMASLKAAGAREVDGRLVFDSGNRSDIEAAIELLGEGLSGTRIKGDAAKQAERYIDSFQSYLMTCSVPPPPTEEAEQLHAPHEGAIPDGEPVMENNDNDLDETETDEGADEGDEEEENEGAERPAIPPPAAAPTEPIGSGPAEATVPAPAASNAAPVIHVDQAMTSPPETDLTSVRTALKEVSLQIIAKQKAAAEAVTVPAPAEATPAPAAIPDLITAAPAASNAAPALGSLLKRRVLAKLPAAAKPAPAPAEAKLAPAAIPDLTPDAPAAEGRTAASPAPAPESAGSVDVVFSAPTVAMPSEPPPPVSKSLPEVLRLPKPATGSAVPTRRHTPQDAGAAPAVPPALPAVTPPEGYTPEERRSKVHEAAKEGFEEDAPDAQRAPAPQPAPGGTAKPPPMPAGDKPVVVSVRGKKTTVKTSPPLSTIAIVITSAIVVLALTVGAFVFLGLPALKGMKKAPPPPTPTAAVGSSEMVKSCASMRQDLFEKHIGQKDPSNYVDMGAPKPGEAYVDWNGVTIKDKGKNAEGRQVYDVSAARVCWYRPMVKSCAPTSADTFKRHIGQDDPSNYVDMGAPKPGEAYVDWNRVTVKDKGRDLVTGRQVYDVSAARVCWYDPS